MTAAQGQPTASVVGNAAPDGLTVMLDGEIDCGNAEALDARLRDMIQTSAARRVVFNVEAVEFCDVAGVRMLTALQLWAAAAGVTVSLSRPRPHFSWLLHMVGAAGLLKTY
ncbi:MAG: STAS domain-containing protein [Actinoplanes sp.]